MSTNNPLPKLLLPPHPTPTCETESPLEPTCNANPTIRVRNVIVAPFNHSFSFSFSLPFLFYSLPPSLFLTLHSSFLNPFSPSPLLSYLKSLFQFVYTNSLRKAGIISSFSSLLSLLTSIPLPIPSFLYHPTHAHPPPYQVTTSLRSFRRFI